MSLPLWVAAIAVAAASAGVAALLLPIAWRAGLRVGFVDLPRRGEAADRPLPRTGGYAVIVALLAGLLVSVVLPVERKDALELQRLAGLAIGALAIVPIAILDDRFRLGPWPQFVAQFGLAFIAVALGIRIDEVSNPFGGTLPVPTDVIVPLTLLWIVGMINTVNFADGIDGLAGGIGAIGAATLCLATWFLGQSSLALPPLALGAACLIFLTWNVYPSRIILGTSGAWLIGYALAVLSIVGGAKIATALLVLGLPIADVASVIVYRLARGRHPFKGGDRAHLHHRLLDLGLSQRQVAGVFYALCASFGLLAILLPRVRLLGLGLQVIIIGAILIYVLTRRRTHPRPMP